jgi:Na+/proline symporter
VKHEVLRIEPRSALRIGFLLGLLGGFVFGLIEVLLFRAMSQAGGEAVLPPGAQELIGSGPGALVLVAVVTGLISSLVFALVGALTAIFYNLGARLFGGIEISLDEPVTQPPRPAEPDDEDRRDV